MKDYSNYHEINTNEKISHDGLLLLEKSLNGFEGQDVVINSSINSKVLMYQKWDADSERKKVIGRMEDIDRGNLLKIGDLYWLVTTVPEDNKIYRKAEMRLCNSTFPILSNKTQVLIGHDEDGRPQYQDSYDVTYEPCIVESKFFADNENNQLPIPEGRIYITMRFQSNDQLKVNAEFEMYGNTYKIHDFDLTKVINEVGIMVIHAERVVE